MLTLFPVDGRACRTDEGIDAKEVMNAKTLVLYSTYCLIEGVRRQEESRIVIVQHE